MVIQGVFHGEVEAADHEFIIFENLRCAFNGPNGLKFGSKSTHTQPKCKRFVENTSKTLKFGAFVPYGIKKLLDRSPFR